MKKNTVIWSALFKLVEKQHSQEIKDELKSMQKDTIAEINLYFYPNKENQSAYQNLNNILNKKLSLKQTH